MGGDIKRKPRPGIRYNFNNELDYIIYDSLSNGNRAIATALIEGLHEADATLRVKESNFGLGIYLLRCAECAEFNIWIDIDDGMAIIRAKYKPTSTYEATLNLADPNLLDYIIKAIKEIKEKAYGDGCIRKKTDE